MKYYFSGVTTQADTEILIAAGAQHLLVDAYDLATLTKTSYEDRLAVDSGAYRAFKAEQPLTVDAWRAMVANLEAQRKRIDFIVAPDKIADPATSHANWLQVRGEDTDVIPVWQWGDTYTRLHEYVQEAVKCVGVGGIVPLLRSRRSEKLSPEQRKAWNSAREKALQELINICKDHPGRLHLFGLCWHKALEALAPYAQSADSSIWLEGARYGYALFKNTRTGKLCHAPAKVIPEYKGFDRRALLLLAAQTLIAEYK